jgi:hypothetical protein
LATKATKLLADCFIRLNEIDVPYFYDAIGSDIVPGSISHLLGINDVQIKQIYQACGFYNDKKSCFAHAFFQGFIRAYDLPIDITRYKARGTTVNLNLVKIGQDRGQYKLGNQVKDGLEPPDYRLKKEARKLVDDLVELCCKEVDDTPSTPSVDTPSTPRVDTSPTTDDTSRSPSKSNVPKTMCEQFNIHTPDKRALALELVEELKTPDRGPIMRQLVT